MQFNDEELIHANAVQFVIFVNVVFKVVFGGMNHMHTLAILFLLVFPSFLMKQDGSQL